MGLTRKPDALLRIQGRCQDCGASIDPRLRGGGRPDDVKSATLDNFDIRVACRVASKSQRSARFAYLNIPNRDLREPVRKGRVHDKRA